MISLWKKVVTNAPLSFCQFQQIMSFGECVQLGLTPPPLLGELGGFPKSFKMYPPQIDFRHFTRLITMMSQPNYFEVL